MKEKIPIVPGAEGFALCHSWPGVGLRYSHHHEELEVNLVLSGKAAYLFGRERIPLVAGSMIWLFPRQEHMLIDRSHDFMMWVLVFKPKFVEHYTQESGRRILRSPDPGTIFCRQLDPPTVDAFNHIYQSAATGENDLELTNTALAYALVASWQAFQLSSEPIARTDVHPAVARAVRLISEAEEAVPLTKLARMAGLSAPRLSRLFKKQTGISLTAFRQRKFLERFLRIYRTGARYSMIEAALLAGFGSYPQFHRVFRHHMGRSPAEYARITRGEGV
ncbi:MAG: AraC family transcriptional regulator [Chthoniobacteraceae bacterium]